MTHYSDKSSMVRVDFFRPLGKWYMTEAWDMYHYYDVGSYPADAVEQMLMDNERGKKLLSQFNVIILEPYHKSSYPVMLTARFQ